MPMRVKTKYRACKKNYSWNPSTCICENSKYLKHIVADSVIACDKVIYVMDIVPINMTSTIPTNISANSDDKKVIYDGFISDNTTINNRYYLLSLYET